MEQLVEHSHANMKIIGSSSQETIIVDLAKSGFATGFLSQIAFSHTQEDGITAVPLKPPIPTRIYLVCRSDASKMIT